jgi:hypothetical protein
MRPSVLLCALVVAAAAAILMWRFDDVKAQLATSAPLQTAHFKGSSKMNSGVIELSLGQSGADVMKQAKAPIKRGQTAGLVFYESSDIENSSEPTLRLLHLQRTLELPQARSVLLIADEARGHNIEDIEVSVKLPELQASSNNPTALAVYDKQIYALLTDIVTRVKAAGWKRYIDPSSARIEGWASFDSNAGTRPDPDHALSFEQWQTVAAQQVSWEWHQPGAFLRLTFVPGRANNQVMDKVRLEVESERLSLLAFDSSGEGDERRALESYRLALPKMLAQRKLAEAKARAAGIRILEEWADPAVSGIAVPKN